MEADWEFEVGGDAPVIEAHWPGLVDLRQSPERAGTLPEAAQVPALAQALASLNAPGSPVWTSKCDVLPELRPDEFDPGELDASPEDAAHAMACYIDLLPSGEQEWNRPDQAAAACKHMCILLRAVPLSCSRVDLVIRRACLTPDRADLGITAYFTACGPNTRQARATLQAALAAFAHVLQVNSTLE